MYTKFILKHVHKHLARQTIQSETGMVKINCTAYILLTVFEPIRATI